MGTRRRGTVGRSAGGAGRDVRAADALPVPGGGARRLHGGAGDRRAGAVAIRAHGGGAARRACRFPPLLGGIGIAGGRGTVVEPDRGPVVRGGGGIAGMGRTVAPVAAVAGHRGGGGGDRGGGVAVAVGHRAPRRDGCAGGGRGRPLPGLDPPLHGRQLPHVPRRRCPSPRRLPRLRHGGDGSRPAGCRDGLRGAAASDAGPERGPCGGGALRAALRGRLRGLQLRHRPDRPLLDSHRPVPRPPRIPRVRIAAAPRRAGRCTRRLCRRLRVPNLAGRHRHARSRRPLRPHRPPAGHRHRRTERRRRPRNPRPDPLLLPQLPLRRNRLRLRRPQGVLPPQPPPHRALGKPLVVHRVSRNPLLARRHRRLQRLPARRPVLPRRQHPLRPPRRPPPGRCRPLHRFRHIPPRPGRPPCRYRLGPAAGRPRRARVDPALRHAPLLPAHPAPDRTRSLALHPRRRPHRNPRPRHPRGLDPLARTHLPAPRHLPRPPIPRLHRRCPRNPPRPPRHRPPARHPPAGRRPRRTPARAHCRSLPLRPRH